MADDLAASISPSADVTRAELQALNERAQKWSPQQILAYALTRFAPASQAPATSAPGERFAIASSFSAEDNVVVDIAMRISRRFRVITLDTGRLPEETYAVQDEVRARYGVRIDALFPRHEDVERLVQIKGAHSFRTSIADRKECCGIRKLEPLSRALANVDAWATGLRAAQSITRAAVAPFELEEVRASDARDGQPRARVKVNPLWRMSDDELWKYVKEHGVPVSALYAKGYTSIGCAPCTRAVAAGEDARAGRWWWEAAEHKECGLHAHAGATHG